MIKKLFTLFKLGRKVAKSDILDIASKFQKPPLAITIIFKLLAFSLSDKKNSDINKDAGERLSDSLENLGTTFIKLGQFLGTRPDIVGKDLAKELQSLQDDLPPFDMEIAERSIKEEIGEKKIS